MHERMQDQGVRYHPTNATKMANDIGPRKTMVVVVIVVGCFAVLWPKVFYPMLVGPVHQTPIATDRVAGCCDVLSETDVHTIKIMSELCQNIIKKTDEKPLTAKEIIKQCKIEVLKTCGIDISAVLQEQIRLGHTFKQIIDEVRSLNGSLCLKYNFGISPWYLGARHIVTVDLKKNNIKQERPPHLRPDLIHPAFRERGSAITKPQHVPKPIRPPPRIVEGRPGPIPGMRPTMGGAGHVVPPSQKGTSSMSIIMPIYTIGIVIFFTYTLMKLMFKKQPDPASLYTSIPPDPTFRKDVFESQTNYVSSRRDSRLGWKERDARDTELDQLRRRLRETESAMERIVEQMSKVPLGTQILNGNLSNGSVSKSHEDEHTSVKVLGMEMTASCEGGQKWGQPHTPIISVSPPTLEEFKEPPQEIYLEGSLPAQSKILVSDAAIESQASETIDDPAVVLAGKVTLSVINDTPNDVEETVEITDINGDDIEEELIEESKYTTASSATAAENDISDPEDDNIEGSEDEEVEEIIEEIEVDDEEENEIEINYIEERVNHNDLDNEDVNHLEDSSSEEEE